MKVTSIPYLQQASNSLVHLPGRMCKEALEERLSAGLHLRYPSEVSSFLEQGCGGWGLEGQLGSSLEQENLICREQGGRVALVTGVQSQRTVANSMDSGTDLTSVL